SAFSSACGAADGFPPTPPAQGARAMKRPWLPLALASIALALVLAQAPFFRVSSVPHDAPEDRVPLDGSLDPLGTAALTPIFIDGPEARERIASEGDLARLYPDVVFRF